MTAKRTIEMYNQLQTLTGFSFNMIEEKFSSPTPLVWENLYIYKSDVYNTSITVLHYYYWHYT